MAQYKHLPIYKITYNLLNSITRNTKHFPKDFKYSLGTKLRDESVELVVLIYKANSKKEQRRETIDSILERLQVIELLLRLSKDMHLLSVSSFSSMIEITDNLNRQATGWLRSTRSREAESN